MNGIKIRFRILILTTLNALLMRMTGSTSSAHGRLMRTLLARLRLLHLLMRLLMRLLRSQRRDLLMRMMMVMEIIRRRSSPPPWGITSLSAFLASRCQRGREFRTSICFLSGLSSHKCVSVLLLPPLVKSVCLLSLFVCFVSSS